MAFTIRFDGAVADALQRRAAAEDRPVEDLVHELVSDHVARSASPDLAAQIEQARTDDDVTSRLAQLVDRDREILDRLAE